MDENVKKVYICSEERLYVGFNNCTVLLVGVYLKYLRKSSITVGVCFQKNNLLSIPENCFSLAGPAKFITTHFLH